MKDIATIEAKMGYTWVKLPEQITMYNCRELELEVLSKFGENDNSVVLDFSKTAHVYSSGLGFMIRIRKEAAERGGVVCLVNVSAYIRDLLGTLNLDKVFPMYATDVEFEISQDDVWDRKLAEHRFGFLFLAQIESGVYRLNLSGDMLGANDLSPCAAFEPRNEIAVYVFDLSNLDLVDNQGATVFRSLVTRITGVGGTCRAFGATEMLRESLQLLGAEEGITFFADERSALQG